MNDLEATVSTGRENTVSIPYPLPWQLYSKVCIQCGRDNPDELMLLCRKHGGTHIHMQCFWKLQSYQSKSGNVFSEMKKCPSERCIEILRIVYNNQDIVFPISKAQRILFVINPIIWIIGIVCAIAFCILFSNCTTTVDGCAMTSFAIHGIGSLFFITGLVTRPTDAVNYLEMSYCKRLAKIRAFAEMLIVAVALAIGSVPSIYFNVSYEINIGFAVWLLVFQMFILPIICIYYIKKHINLIKKINALTVSTNTVSFAIATKTTVYVDLPMD